MLREGQISNLRILCINNKKVYIVDDHNYVLPIWSYYSLQNDYKYDLITLDYHADTIIGFNDYAYEKAFKTSYVDTFQLRDRFREEKVKEILNNKSFNIILDNTRLLDCDEHILAAWELGIITEYHVIYCMDKYEEYGGEHCKNEKIYCEAFENPTKYCYKTCPEIEKNRCHNRLDDEYLKDIKLNLSNRKYILDMDLDYFQTRESLKPIRRNIINGLIKNCEFITIARSKKYFNELRIDYSFNIDEAENNLVKLIEEILNN
ncbi:TPA: UPF0489 family protein [Clostridium botulinum]|nr:UPF0489 family protein [Clostridium botulinum]